MESLVSDTTSLRTSMLEYRWENGRRYTAAEDSKYWCVQLNAYYAFIVKYSKNSLCHSHGFRGPNDEKQQIAEDLLYVELCLLTKNRIA